MGTSVSCVMVSVVPELVASMPGTTALLNVLVAYAFQVLPAGYAVVRVNVIDRTVPRSFILELFKNSGVIGKLVRSTCPTVMATLSLSLFSPSLTETY